jgi:glycine cleavage system H protein
MNVPEDLRYAESHEWVRVEDGVGTVGITDHAQNELTDIVYAEPPAAGKTVSAGGTAAVVESVKAASDIYSPVSGEVIEGNEALSTDPALLNTDPFGAGWIFKVRLSDPAELERLKSPTDYRAQIS